MAKNNFPISAFRRDGTVVPAGHILIKDDAHRFEEIFSYFFTGDVNTVQNVNLHLQALGGFGHCDKFAGNLHCVKHNTLAGARDMGKQTVLNRVVL